MPVTANVVINQRLTVREHGTAAMRLSAGENDLPDY
ncbi:MAG: hypothetical protein JWR22_2396 [Herminiimonas sp.]|nr:hypothetical protein [Herminiimonas sp.]